MARFTEELTRQLEQMTDSQREAVLHTEGPLLVLAGPGSGKTRVITNRIARLVSEGVPAHRILAITFTNKAAQEMLERTQAALDNQSLSISTFHRFCARLLRKHANAVGLKPNYTILDTADQRQLLKSVLYELDFDSVHYPPARLANRISAAKNELITPERFAQRFEESIADHFEAVVARVYPTYQQRLKQANAVDFDDLLLLVVQILIENPELRREMDRRYEFLLVDEYQDTNTAQYEIVKGLSLDCANVCVVGDADQSIYGWRGARIENILRFERDFPSSKTIRLEENFRSTAEILRVADELIAHNRQRKPKRLRAVNEQGTCPALLQFTDAAIEADGISRFIRQRVDQGLQTFRDFAVFYRVNSLSRQLELSLGRYGIPYQTAGPGFRDRAEVKDLLAYVRLVANPEDNPAFVRIVNKPVRGIGKTTQDRLMKWARETRVSYLEAAERAGEIPNLPKRAVTGLRKFAELIAAGDVAESGSVAGTLRALLEKSGLKAAYLSKQQESDFERIDSLEELVMAAEQYDRQNRDERSLEGFLEGMSLASDVDSVDASQGVVTLMTLHAAKGLEFPVVFLVGLEENLLPHKRAMETSELHELEEERRLLFVGLTRARRELFLTLSKIRSSQGRREYTIPSSFLNEMQLDRINGDLWALDNDSREQQPNAEKVDDEEHLSLPNRGDRQRRGSRAKEGLPSLMTGADLLGGGKNSTAQLPLGFSVGSLARHPQYGRGKVIATGGFGSKRTATVEFEQTGNQQTFVVAKSPLQPIGS